MEQRNHVRPTTPPPQPAEPVTALEWTLLRRFRGMRPSDQAAVIRLMDALAKLTELEG